MKWVISQDGNTDKINEFTSKIQEYMGYLDNFLHNTKISMNYLQEGKDLYKIKDNINILRSGFLSGIKNIDKINEIAEDILE